MTHVKWLINTFIIIIIIFLGSLTFRQTLGHRREGIVSNCGWHQECQPMRRTAAALTPIQKKWKLFINHFQTMEWSKPKLFVTTAELITEVLQVWSTSSLKYYCHVGGSGLCGSEVPLFLGQHSLVVASVCSSFDYIHF